MTLVAKDYPFISNLNITEDEEEVVDVAEEDLSYGYIFSNSENLIRILVGS